MISESHNIDCIDYMKGLSDKWIDLAIVDPPYGIGRDGGETGKNWKWYEEKKWDKDRPSAEYWRELFRVSKNQVVWGANYFTEYLPASMGWIFWDKGQNLTMSDGELAFTSFHRALRRIKVNRCKISEGGGNIHPVQKPISIYRWILENYAKPGDKILDTHLGSGSSRIAAHQLGFDFYGTEIDFQYFQDQEKRYKEVTSQLRMRMDTDI